MNTPGTSRSRHAWLLLTSMLVGSLPVIAAAQDASRVVLDEVTLSGEAEDGATDSVGYTPRRSTAGTKTRTPLAETPATVSVVTDAQMQDQGVTSVAQALRYTPGVASEYRGTSNISDETYIRGFGYVARYLDGLVVTGQGQQIDPWLIDSVAVVKGPSSLLYGQANPGGLIDMELKKADGTDFNRAGVTLGTSARVGARLDMGRRIDDALSWRLVGLAERADTQEEGLETRRLTLMPSLRWAPTDATTVTAFAIYQREPDAGYRNFRQALGTLNSTSYGYIPSDFLVGDPDFERSERTSKSFGWEVEHRLSDAVTLRHKARYSISDWDQRTLVWGRLGTDERTISRTVTDSYTKTEQAVVDNQVEYRLNAAGAEHVILGGIDMQYTRTDDDTTSGLAANSIDWLSPVYGNVVTSGTGNRSAGISRTRQTGIYVQDQLKIGQLHVQAGLRYDWAKNDSLDLTDGSRETYDSEALTGRIGVLYDLGNGFSPYISYSTSFEPVTQVAPSGEDPYDPTEGKQWEVGVKWANPAQTLMVTASAYDLRQTNVLKTDPATDLARQVGEIKSRGFELEGQGQITDAFSLVAGYAYNDSKISKSPIEGEVGTHNDRMPRHQASLWGKYEFANGWDVALGARYTGKSWARANAFTVPGVTVFDMAVGYDLGKLDSRYDGVQAQLNVTNLTDKVYTSSCASAYACWVGAERQAKLSIDYTW
jgi:iron complex outermembrane receptor protein